MRDRLGEHAGPQRGDLTGPNPVDRGKKGSKIHQVTDRQGLPLSMAISGANTHDSQALQPLVEGIPRSALAVALGGADRPSCTVTRATTTPTCAAGSAGGGSSTVWPAGRGVFATVGQAPVAGRAHHGLAGRMPPPAPRLPADHFLAFAGIACTLICYRRLTK